MRASFGGSAWLELRVDLVVIFGASVVELSFWRLRVSG